MVAAVASALGLAGTAHATIAERSPYQYSETRAEQICGYAVDVAEQGHGLYAFRAGTGRDAGAFFVHQTYWWERTITNPDNGKYWTESGHGMFADVRATRIDGDVFEFTTIEAGQPFAAYDMDGELIVRDRGLISHTYTFDTLGDGVPGGVYLETVELRVAGPHPFFFADGADVCAVVDELIG